MRAFFGIVVVLIVGVAVVSYTAAHRSGSISESVSTTEVEFELFDDINVAVPSRFGDLETWRRPVGPPRVGLQVGHWKREELPDELKRLRERGGGASGGGKAEWETNLAIAEETKEFLEAEGVIVDILPSTIPPAYWADVFIAIHADGNVNSEVSGFKVAAPHRDLTGRAGSLVDTLEAEYARSTGLRLDFNVTRNMRGYYAFNWRRYEHAVHPMTVAAILETGFLTSPVDQRVIVAQPRIAARGIADAVLKFLDV